MYNLFVEKIKICAIKAQGKEYLKNEKKFKNINNDTNNYNYEYIYL